MKRTLLVLFVLVPVLGIAATFGTGWYSRRPVEAGLEAGVLRPCPASPNCVCSEGSDPTVEPLRFTGEPEIARERLLALLATLPRIEVRVAEAGYVHAVVTSAVVGFADDLEFRIDPERKQIHVRSASRVGYSDMGVNQARVQDLRARWSAVPD